MPTMQMFNRVLEQARVSVRALQRFIQVAEVQYAALRTEEDLDALATQPDAPTLTPKAKSKRKLRTKPALSESESEFDLDALATQPDVPNGSTSTGEHERTSPKAKSKRKLKLGKGPRTKKRNKRSSVTKEPASRSKTTKRSSVKQEPASRAKTNKRSSVKQEPASRSKTNKRSSVKQEPASRSKTNKHRTITLPAAGTEKNRPMPFALQDEQDVVIDGIPYEQLKWEPSVARSHCPACFSNLAELGDEQIEKKEEIFECPNCGILLVYESAVSSVDCFFTLAPEDAYEDFAHSVPNEHKKYDKEEEEESEDDEIRSVCSLHITCMFSAHHLHVLCTLPACSLHITCMLSAQLLHVLCT